MSSSAVQLTQYEAVPMPLACANCEEVISGTPYQADGEVFCCVGCSGGGPCQCTYFGEGSVALEPAVIAETAPVYTPAPEPPAPVATTPIRPTPIEPAPLAWPAPEQTAPVIRSRPQILRVSGLENQLDVLRLGSELEAEPEIEDVALVRADLDDIWFAVTVADADGLADALMRVASFDVDARPHPAGVDASVTVRTDEPEQPLAPVVATPVQPEVASIPATADTRREEPHARPRFRLFRLFRRAEEATPPAAVTPEAEPVIEEPVRQTLFAEPTPEPVVADLEPEPAVEDDEPIRHSLFTTATSAPVVEEPVRPVAAERFAAAIETPASTPEPVVIEATQVQPAAIAPAIELAPEVIEVIEAQPELVIEQPAAIVETPIAVSPVREQPSEMLTADARPGGAVTMREHITLVAYPFRSFVALNEFQDALRGLRGVANVKVRRFYRGTLHLGVEYEDMLPLTERLRDLEGFAWRLVSSSEQEIELMLEEQGDLVSSG